MKGYCKQSILQDSSLNDSELEQRQVAGVFNYGHDHLDSINITKFVDKLGQHYFSTQMPSMS